jgi:hypothetical protein
MKHEARDLHAGHQFMMVRGTPPGVHKYLLIRTGRVIV